MNIYKTLWITFISAATYFIGCHAMSPDRAFTLLKIRPTASKIMIQNAYVTQMRKCRNNTPLSTQTYERIKAKSKLLRNAKEIALDELHKRNNRTVTRSLAYMVAYGYVYPKSK